MASRKIKIRDVFKSLGQPTITYVERDEGLYERQLISALNSKGKLCLITGPSKTGKTTLYKRILKGWAWLANIIGEVSLGVNSSMNDTP